MDTQQLAGEGGRRWGREGRPGLRVPERAMACAKVQGPERAANTREPHVLRDRGR